MARSRSSRAWARSPECSALLPSHDSASVTEFTEHRQALLGVTVRGSRVAPDHRHLGAGAQGGSDSPPVAERAEACQRPADHGFAHGWVTEVRGDEAVE